jgi:hypothetical protein
LFQDFESSESENSAKEETSEKENRPKTVRFAEETPVRSYLPIEIGTLFYDRGVWENPTDLSCDQPAVSLRAEDSGSLGPKPSISGLEKSSEPVEESITSEAILQQHSTPIKSEQSPPHLSFEVSEQDEPSFEWEDENTGFSLSLSPICNTSEEVNILEVTPANMAAVDPEEWTFVRASFLQGLVDQSQFYDPTVTDVDSESKVTEIQEIRTIISKASKQLDELNKTSSSAESPEQEEKNDTPFSPSSSSSQETESQSFIAEPVIDNNQLPERRSTRIRNPPTYLLDYTYTGLAESSMSEH